MSNRKRFQAVPQPLRSLNKAIKAILNWLSRGLLNLGKPQRRQATAGFVLPTVAMVMLVVALLTTAMVLRSFDRSKNASNVRVNEATLNAASPALDRARTKIEELFSDPTLPRATPTDAALLRVIEGNANKYTFGDETPLKIVFDFGNFQNPNAPNPNQPDGVITPVSDTTPIENREVLTTAWKFPVDTDNNGKFDTFTLYGLYLRSPSRDNTGQFNRPRNPLEARTPPMDEGGLGAICQSANATSANLVGDSGWYKQGSQLKKALYVYTTNVPITQLPPDIENNAGLRERYEVFSGNQGFSALEYQQDRSRIPLANNAIVYEDDLEILPGQGLTLNGRIFTNSNLFLGRTTNNPVQLFLVSSKESCFFQEEASKILIGGNVANAQVNSNNDERRTARIDRYRPGSSGGLGFVEDSFAEGQKTTAATGGTEVAYNSAAYNHRINRLVQAVIDRSTASLVGTSPNITGINYSGQPDPDEIRNRIRERLNDDKSLTLAEVRREELEVYFRKRTRRVPFAEVRTTDRTTALGTYETNNPLLDNPLRPVEVWAYPVNPTANNANFASYANLQLRLASCNNTACPPATDPDDKRGNEYRLGDRMLVGNNLPEVVYNHLNTPPTETSNQLVVRSEGEVKWLRNPTGNTLSEKTRIRTTQVTQLADFGVTDRNGFWETSAAEAPTNPVDNIGGLRVVTGAGIYLPDDQAAMADTTNNVIWPDFMPMASRPTSTSTDPQAGNFLAMERLFPPVNPVPSAQSYQDDNADGTIDLADDPNDDTPYLRMRASAVYHYRKLNPANKDDYNVYEPSQDRYQSPYACVSSYYDPTNATTAKNRTGLPFNAATGGHSNNGITYPWLWENNYNGAFGASWYGRSYRDHLTYQANLRYPNGLPVNETLRKALFRVIDGTEQPRINGSGDLISYGNLPDGSPKNPALNLAERTAIDTAICSLDILRLNDTGSDATRIPHGTVYETAFLDGREIKANDDPARTREYDMTLEERQPLEIRSTVIDLQKLRETLVPNNYPAPQPPIEFLLPNSGIIYATREDAVPDRSSPSANAEEQKRLSTTDYILDYRRRPNSIMLINGRHLNRGTATPNNNQNRQEEKGLILATNLPVYVKGNFNLHDHTEFLSNPGTDLTSPGNFYGRTNLNSNFACRVGQFAQCTTGDRWRPATVLADAVNLLSENFKEGFRQDGDYDLRHNAFDDLRPETLNPFGYDFDPYADGLSATRGINERVLLFNLNPSVNTTLDTDVKETQIERIPRGIKRREERRKNGFFDNSFVTNRPFTDANYSATGTFTPVGEYSAFSSYFNNFVAPVQRRTTFPEYVMEICRKLPVSECTPDDWVVGYDFNGDGDLFDDFVSEVALDWDFNHDGDKTDTDIPEKDIKAADLIANIESAPSPSEVAKLGAGTTAFRGRPLPSTSATSEAAIAFEERFPRRVAFLRYPANDPDTAVGINNYRRNELVLAAGAPATPIALGITNDRISYHAYSAVNLPIDSTTKRFNPESTTLTVNSLPTTLPTPQANGLWFTTTANASTPTNDAIYGNDNRLFYRLPLQLSSTTGATLPSGTSVGVGTLDHPLLVPVVQLQVPSGGPQNNNFDALVNSSVLVNATNWLQIADGDTTASGNQPSTFNLVIAAGDSPARPIENNGGVANFPRFLENWRPNGNETATQISGSFIQLKRSEYATAPFRTLLDDSNSGTFPSNGSANSNVAGILPGRRQIYKTDNLPLGNGGLLPQYTAPNRAWGFDVALLTQQPDLFAQRFTVPPASPPNEFFRQMNRNDRWVEALLCAAQPTQATISGAPVPLPDGYEAAPAAFGNGFRFAIPANQRSICDPANPSSVLRFR
ncbi:hormogonium polysaccharide biosynthesis protein HpsA [Geitlerinema splendidum]|nr:hormogonium polysaccharide biosynthesis protein HpsA [Geitlerinema splendidum]